MALQKPKTKKVSLRISIGRFLTPQIYGLILSIGLSISLLLWRLVSLTNGMVNPSELDTKHLLFIHSPWWSKSLSGIYGPYYLLLHATYAINRSLFEFRITSVIIGILTVAIVYWLVSGWHGYKIGLMVSLIILGNFGLVAASREATPLIAQLLFMITLLLAIAMLNQKASLQKVIFLMVVIAGGFYVPGGIWLDLVTLALCRKAILSVWSGQSKLRRSEVLAVPIVLIAPLIYQIVAHYTVSQLNTFIGYGLGNNQAHFLHNFLTNFINVPADLFVYSRSLGPSLSLGHLPIVPIAFSLLFILGLYSYATRLTNWRWRAVVILLGAGWLLGGFGVFSPLALVPLIAVTAGTGLAFMLKEWYEIFPRNPIARSLGLLIMLAVITLGSVFAVRSYIVAWANSPATTSLYTRRLN